MQHHILSSSVKIWIIISTSVYVDCSYLLPEAVIPINESLESYTSPPELQHSNYVKSLPRSPPAYAAENQLLAYVIRQALESQGLLGQSARKAGTEIEKGTLYEHPPGPRGTLVDDKNLTVTPSYQMYGNQSQWTKWTPITPNRKDDMANRNIIQYRNIGAKSSLLNSVVQKALKPIYNNHTNNLFTQAVKISESDESTNNAILETHETFTEDIGFNVQNNLNISSPSLKHDVIPDSPVHQIQHQLPQTEDHKVSKVTQRSPESLVNGSVQDQQSVHSTNENYKQLEPQTIQPEIKNPQPDQQDSLQSPSYQVAQHIQSSPQSSQSNQFQEYQQTSVEQLGPVRELTPEEEFPFPTISIASDSHGEYFEPEFQEYLGQSQQDTSVLSQVKQLPVHHTHQLGQSLAEPEPVNHPQVSPPQYPEPAVSHSELLDVAQTKNGRFYTAGDTFNQQFIRYQPQSAAFHVQSFITQQDTRESQPRETLPFQSVAEPNLSTTNPAAVPYSNNFLFQENLVSQPLNNVPFNQPYHKLGYQAQLQDKSVPHTLQQQRQEVYIAQNKHFEASPVLTVVRKPEQPNINKLTSQQSTPVTFTAPIVNPKQEIALQEVNYQAQPIHKDSKIIYIDAALHSESLKLSLLSKPADSIPSPSEEQHQIMIIRPAIPIAAQQTFQLEMPQNPPQQTKVYILQSEPQVNQNITVRLPPPPKRDDPEIKFVNYADSDLIPHQPISEFNMVTDHRGSRDKTYEMYAPQMPHELYYTHPIL